MERFVVLFLEGYWGPYWGPPLEKQKATLFCLLLFVFVVVVVVCCCFLGNFTMSKKVGVSEVWNRFNHKLFVYLIEAKGLRGLDKDGTSDPVAKVHIGKAAQKSKALKKTIDPQFGDLFFFTDPEDPSLKIEISCSKKSKFLGQAELANLDSLPVEKIHDIWVDLQPKPGKKQKKDAEVTGKVHVRLVYSRVSETRMPGEETNYKAFYQQYMGQFKTGDLIVYSGVGLLPEITKVMTGSPYTHLGMIVELPNRWTQIPELYVVELYRNPDNFLDIKTDKPRSDLSMFRLFERFYQFFGTQIWYVPLKSPLSPAGISKMTDYIKTCSDDPTELAKIISPFDPSIPTWIQTTFGAKYFSEPDFVDLASGAFVTECLHIGEAPPPPISQTVRSPQFVVTYPCFGEPLPIRPFDKEELEKLQKASPPPLTSFSSGLGNGMVNGGGAVDIVFEGFSDMSKLSLSFSEGTTLGEFKSALVQQKGVDPRGIKVLERVNGSETEMLDQSAVLSIDSLSKGSDYMIKVVNSNVGGKGLSHAAVHDFDALGHRALSDSRDFGEGGARRMIIPEFQDSKITKYEKLGSGAFGSVWRVGFEGFTCAMKVLTITDKTDSYDIESLKMETEILEKANHKNIVRYLGHEFREKEMRVFLEFVPFSLRGLLDQMQAQSLSPQTAKKIMVNVARGINYMHNLSPPIIHRDIKSANILCVKDEEGGVEVAKLCDFGVSKLVEEENQAQTYVGTLAFMAPEIRHGKGKKVYTTAVDIYSLGIVMWEILTLQKPHKITKRPDWSGQEFNPLYDLQAQCCRNNPQQRPNAKQVVDILSLMYND